MGEQAGSGGFDPQRQLEIIRRELARRRFCVLATSSPQNRPHAVGMMYAAVGTTVYLITDRDTVKVRNILANPQVAVSIPVRRSPFGPPMAVQFQGTARILDRDHPRIRELLAAGRLKRIVRFGVVDLPGTCFVEVTPARRISSFGVGVPLWRLLRDVGAARRSVVLPAG
jgi:hypothetical protein